MSQPTENTHQTDTPQYEIKLYPIENKFLACLDTTKDNFQSNNVISKLETVIILDQSGSMGDSVPNIINNVLPKFFDFLSYDPETIINLIAFESRTWLYKIKVGDFKNVRLYCAGGTYMSPAVSVLHSLYRQFQSSINALRILTISDGEVFDQEQTKQLGGQLAEFAEKCNISVNSQAVRFFTYGGQPDTTALCSLLQLNNVEKSQLSDINSRSSYEEIAGLMADLFKNDGFGLSKVLQSNEAIYFKFPWDMEPTDQLLMLPERNNIFWVEKVDFDAQDISIDGEFVKISIHEDITFDQLLQYIKLDFLVDRMKILKILDSSTAKETIERIVAFFSTLENILIKLAEKEATDTRSIENRVRLVKLNAITSKRFATFLETIANDQNVHQLNSEQKANYLRNVQVTSKAGRGLAMRAAKNWSKCQNFDEIVHKEVQAIKANFNEIKDIENKKHSVSFYSQATTLEGIRTLIEFTDDVTFPSLSADDILQIINLVGIACSCPVGDFPDASTWRVNEIFYGCYVSVADIITSIHQSGDTGFVLKAPGIDKEITNVIPVFDDPRIGVFLKKYAPSILEFTSSIGMRRVVADVPMTFGYTIIAGIRRMMYDLNKNKSTVHLETFKNLISTACLFVGKYFDHVEKLLINKYCGVNGYFLDNNGIASLLVPLIRIHNKKNHPGVKRMPDILRSIYSYEIWKGISKEYKGKQKFNEIIKDMLYKLLGIDLEANKIKLAPLFEPDVKRSFIKFPDDFKIDQEYLDKLTQPLYYHNYMSLLPQLLTAVTSGKLDDIKNIPLMTKNSAMEAFGIDYSYKKFVYLNVFQALRYPRRNVRADTKSQTMKIIDLKHQQIATNDVRQYVREQFEAQYDFDVRAKRRQEELEMAQTLVDSLINETNYQAMINTWKNGITKNNITYKIANSSSTGFKLLCRKLVDLKMEIPLRSKLIAVLLLGVDADDQVVYNNGEIADIKDIKKYKKKFLITETIEEWEKIEQKYNSRPIHAYREKENRKGHSNAKRSFWGLGYNTISDFFDANTKNEQIKYFKRHSTCCIARSVLTCPKLSEKKLAVNDLKQTKPLNTIIFVKRPQYQKRTFNSYDDCQHEIERKIGEAINKKLKIKDRNKAKLSRNIKTEAIRSKRAVNHGKLGNRSSNLDSDEVNLSKIATEFNKMSLKRNPRFNKKKQKAGVFAKISKC